MSSTLTELKDLYDCMYCDRGFSSQFSFIKHLDQHKSASATQRGRRQGCNIDGCNEVFKTNLLPRHRCLFHSSASVAQDNNITSTTDADACEPPPIESIPDPENLPISYQITNSTIEQDLSEFIQSSKSDIQKILSNALDQYHQFQYNISVRVQVSSTRIELFQSKFMALRSCSEIDDTINVLSEIIPIELEEQNSIFAETKVHTLRLNIKQFSIVTGGYLPLPKEIYESVFIVQNYDDYCFKWALLSAVAKYGDESKTWRKMQYVTKYHGDISADHIQYCGVDFDFSGLSFPLKVSSCGIFEERNPHISISVYGLQGRGSECTVAGELYRTRKKQQLHVNLLFLDDIKENKTHYAFIKYLPKLLRARAKPNIRVMDFFEKPSGCNEWKCKLCYRIIKTNGNTSNLWSHVERSHALVLQEIVKMEKKQKSESEVGDID